MGKLNYIHIAAPVSNLSNINIDLLDSELSIINLISDPSYLSLINSDPNVVRDNFCEINLCNTSPIEGALVTDNDELLTTDDDEILQMDF